jgi:hypothetical protein
MIMTTFPPVSIEWPPPRATPLREPAARPGESCAFGVIGYGYWGPNIVRNLRARQREVVAVCDKNPAR